MYAGFIRRLAAFTIDSIILSVIQFMIAIPLIFVIGYPSPIYRVLGVIITFVYYVAFESSAWQATIGKKAIGIKVTDLNGQRLSVGKAALRILAKIVSWLTLGIGYLMCIWTEKRQCLHDSLVGCLVITNEPSPTGDPRPTNPPVWVWLVGLVTPLLIFFLIFGILLAVSLPQYFTAVEKNRSAETYKVLQAMHDSAKRTRLRAGKWPKSFQTLDIGIHGAQYDNSGQILYTNDFVFEAEGWDMPPDNAFTIHAKRAVEGKPTTGINAYTLTMNVNNRGTATFNCSPEKLPVCKSFNEQVKNRQ